MRGQVLLLVVVLALVACASEEKARKKVAGSYAWTAVREKFTSTNTLTLREDGTATMVVSAEAGGDPWVRSKHGSFEVGDLTITTHFSGERDLTYTIYGDTLFPQFARRTGKGQSVIHMALDDSTEQPMVKVRRGR